MSAYHTAKQLSLPNTESSAYSVIALPVYNDMGDWECDGIVQLFQEVHHAAARIRRRNLSL